MWYALFILLTAALFGGFLLLTREETRRGIRLFAKQRSALDAEAERATFIVTHVDFPHYVRESMELIAARIVHDIVHAGLLFVRFLERLLTRAVKELRTRHIIEVPPEAKSGPSSDFVSAMKDFNEELKSGRKGE